MQRTERTGANGLRRTRLWLWWGQTCLDDLCLCGPRLVWTTFAFVGPDLSGRPLPLWVQTCLDDLCLCGPRLVWTTFAFVGPDLSGRPLPLWVQTCLDDLCLCGSRLVWTTFAFVGPDLSGRPLPLWVQTCLDASRFWINSVQTSLDPQKRIPREFGYHAHNGARSIATASKGSPRIESSSPKVPSSTQCPSAKRRTSIVFAFGSISQACPTPSCP